MNINKNNLYKYQHNEWFKIINIKLTTITSTCKATIYRRRLRRTTSQGHPRACAALRMRRKQVIKPWPSSVCDAARQLPGTSSNP